MVTPAEHAATVREALDEICPHEYAVDCDLPEHQTTIRGHRALDALETQAEEQARLADENFDFGHEEIKKRVAAEADREKAWDAAQELGGDLAEMRAERDFLLSDPDSVAIKEWRDQLAARVEELEAALREVTDVDTPTSEVRRIARAALDKDTE